ncbi:MAG: transcriptional regulator, family-like protein [Ramlibacter sp.]|jgi:DNA-binding transcriptional regulator YiaG|nr:transcriptional regulator, family-like protein [Ramlibacter sp.]
MPNIANLLKSEIARVARREVRAETKGLKQAIAPYRAQIAELKRRTRELEQQVNRLGRVAKKTAASAGPEGDTGSRNLRFSAKGLAAQRKRLGLSAQAFGALIGASGQSVYKWEEGKTRPRAKHLPAIASLRTIGKKEAAARLASLER